MTTPSQPPISMENVRAELGASYPISLNQPNVLELAGKSGPPISLLDLLGRTHVALTSMYSAYQPEGDGYNVGFSDGTIAGYAQFGSLAGGAISGHPVNCFVTIYSNNEGNPNFNTVLIVPNSAGSFDNWYLRLYNTSGTLLEVARIVYSGPVGVTSQQYSAASNITMLNSYQNQSVLVSLAAS